ncbi:hypothetical protein M8C21_006779, partial [Ambrosia artemisiifolia]
VGCHDLWFKGRTTKDKNRLLLKYRRKAKPIQVLPPTVGTRQPLPTMILISSIYLQFLYVGMR